MDFKTLTEAGQALGLSGAELLNFVKERDAIERDARARERSLERYRIEDREREREHEAHLRSLNNNETAAGNFADPGLRQLKLLPFKDGDDICAYLTRFDRISAVYQWDNSRKALQLGSLLTDKALAIYSALDDESTRDYEQLKKCLLQSYKLNGEHYRKQFRSARMTSDCTFKQFAIDLARKFELWLSSYEIERDFDEIRDFIVADQFMAAVPPEVRTFIRENNSVKLAEIINSAETYASAHSSIFSKSRSQINKPIKDSERRNPRSNPSSDDVRLQLKPKVDTSRINCYSCGANGPKSSQCPRNPRVRYETANKVTHNFSNQKILGPMYSGSVNGARVSTILRDTGCTCVVVSDELIPDLDLTKAKYWTVSDFLGRTNSFPVVKCYIKCDLFEGWVEAVRAPLKYCSVLLGNVEGTKLPVLNLKPDLEDSIRVPDSHLDVVEDSSQTNKVNVITRASAKRVTHPLHLPEVESLKIDKSKFCNLQNDCDTLVDVRKYVNSGELISTRSGRNFKFERAENLIIRKCVFSPKEIDLGRTTLVVPLVCRNIVLKTAHDLPIAGHFSHRKTEIKVCKKFWWPGVSSDIRRYCRSCDQCQKTSARGRTRKVAMKSMPIISVPFERVAVDLVGPLSPPSNSGHRYILTLIDYASSFLEAVPMKEITSISIAEALVSVFSRVGIPREIISDRGTQFTSELMGEIHKLIGIKPIFTTPYHPMMNGKLERQHAVLKSVLKKLCSEKPKEWDRYLIPTLFAMREIPSDTTGLSPFELVYGRQVRGPLAILHELWCEPELSYDQRSAYEYVLDLRTRLEKSADLALESSKIKADSYKTYFDKRSVKRKFEVDDEVLLLLPDSNNKLLCTWKGPYKVLEVKSDLNYLIDVKGAAKLFHVNMLKRYVRRITESCLNVIDEISTLEYVGVNTEVSQTCVINEEGNEIITLPLVDNCNEFDICPNLSEDYQRELNSILSKHSNAFSDIPGCTRTLKHTIELTSTEAVIRKNYPVPVHLRKHFDDEVDRMLEMGIIEPSVSEYCSPSVMVEKAGKGPKEYRLTNDFRALNSITRFDAEPMPLIEADLHKFSAAKYFTEIDITKAYYQVPLDVNSQKYTAFATSRGLMQYRVLPFGLVTACATYIRLMREVIRDIPDHQREHISIYFDNIYIATEDWESHVELVDLILSKLSEHGLTARMSKCHFGYGETQYLGFKIKDGFLSPLSDRVSAMRDVPIPKTKKQLRSFLGIVSFYRKFIKDLATLSAPLSDMLRKGVKEPLCWNETSVTNFNTLKFCLTNTPILKLPNLKLTFCLRTDASNTGIGAILLQYEDNVPKAVSYASRKLLPREQNYSTIERECLALVWGIDRFKYYLYGAKFILETDHKPLLYLNTFKGTNPRLVRWSLALQSYSFTVVHIPGQENHGADLLSRL